MTTIVYQRSFFADLNGLPLDGGSVYIGTANQDPQTNPISVYWDSALSVPAVQPLTVTAGYVVNNGVRSAVYASQSSYSLRVRNRAGVEVDYVAATDGVVLAADLSNSSGAGMIGYSLAPTYPAGTVGKKLQQDANPLDAPYSATGDGVADDRAALFGADAARALTITGNHRISSNLTFTRAVSFKGTGRLTIDAGVTVTFAAGIAAPYHQIFYGSGGVAGLSESRLEWFVGDADAPYPTVECGAGVRKWLNSVIDDGTLKSIPMHLLVDGSAPYDVSKGQSFIGPGDWQLFFQWQGSACNGFRFTAGAPDGATFTGFQWRVNTPGTIPTSGTALDLQHSYVRLSDFFIDDCYRGVDIGGVVGTFMTEFQIIGAVKSGMRTSDNALDYHVDKFIIQALYDWVTLSGVSGTFNAGDSVTVSTGQTGTIIHKYSNTNYRVRFVGPLPSAGATISKTGASATLASITVGHQDGGMVLLDTGEAVTVRAGDVLGGMKSLVTFTSGGGTRDGFAYSRMSDLYFDSSYEGSSMTNAFGSVLTAVWFASAANSSAKGLSLSGCRRLTFVAPQFVNNAGGALGITANCEDIEVQGLKCDGNCTRGGVAEVYITGGAKNIRFIGGKAGYQGANGVTPPKSFYWDTGDSQKMMMMGVDVPSGSVVDNSTAAEKTFIGISGIAFRNL